MTLEKYRYIVVEGPIGVGKTSLAQRLAKRGVQWQPWEDPLAFAERAAIALPTQAAPIREIANAYANLRYAAPPSRPNSNDALSSLRARIAAFRP